MLLNENIRRCACRSSNLFRRRKSERDDPLGPSSAGKVVLLGATDVSFIPSFVHLKTCRLPVVDDSNRLVGVLTRGGIVRAALAARRSLKKEDAPAA